MKDNLVRVKIKGIFFSKHHLLLKIRAPAPSFRCRPCFVQLLSPPPRCQGALVSFSFSTLVAIDWRDACIPPALQTFQVLYHIIESLDLFLSWRPPSRASCSLLIGLFLSRHRFELGSVNFFPGCPPQFVWVTLDSILPLEFLLPECNFSSPQFLPLQLQDESNLRGLVWRFRKFVLSAG